MSIYTDNIIKLDASTLPKNIRVVIIDGKAYPIGPSKKLEGSEFYKCTSVTNVDGADTQLWAGYKAVLNGNGYTFEETITEGLTWKYDTGYQPEVGKIYTKDATAEISLGKSLPTLPEQSDPVFYASMSSNTAESGHTLTLVKKTDSATGPVYAAVDGIPCATFDGTSKLSFDDSTLPAGILPRTIHCHAKITGTQEHYPNPCLVNYGLRTHYTAGRANGLFIEYDGAVDYVGQGNQHNLKTDAGVIELNTWYALTTVLYRNGSDVIERIYINGVMVKENTASTKNTIVSMGSIAGAMDTHDYNLTGSIANVRVYNRVLSDEEIMELAKHYDNPTPDPEPDPEPDPDPSPEKEYVYTVSGAGTAVVNGDYYDSGVTSLDRTVYTNGPVFLAFSPATLKWTFVTDPTFVSPIIDLYYTQDEPNEDPTITAYAPIDGALPVPTVEHYKSEAPKTYVYSVGGAGSAEANGAYYDSGKTVKTETDEESTQVNLPIYTNDVCEIYPSNGNYHWNIRRIADNQTLYTGPDFYESLVMPDGGSWSRVGQGVEPAPTVTKYAAEGNTPSDKNYVYTVSNVPPYYDGYEKANGNYYPVTVDELKAKGVSIHDGYTVVPTLYTNGECYLVYAFSVSSFGTPSREGWQLVADLSQNPEDTVRFDYLNASGADADVTGSWMDGTIVTKYSGGGGGKEYKYTVSGCTGGKSAANGDYWQIDPPSNINRNYASNYGIFYNGAYYMAFCYFWQGWSLATDLGESPTALEGTDGMIQPGPSNSATPAGTWAMVGITVTDYAG